jgi:hypothetical protein
MKTLCLCLLLFWLPVPANSAGKGRPLATAEVNAVIQAVEDEIHAGEDCHEFSRTGENVGTPQHWKSRLHIYINPGYGGEFQGNEATGEAIYKFMPYGEIIRFFRLRKGQVQLIGDPDKQFPVTQPSHLTTFDGTNEISSLKRTWLSRFFVVDTAPSPEVIQEAARRQKVREQFWDREMQHQK